MAYTSKRTGQEIDELLDKIENFDPEAGDGDDVTPVPLYAEVTYSELKALKDNKQLEAGMKYRITDFMTQTKQINTRSARHPFDVVVTALDATTLSEEAMAIKHEGDTYFRNANLSSWKIWYNFDNDTSKYEWVQKWENDIPQKWVSQWGVLEEQYNDEVSNNYIEVEIDDATKFLYRPETPTNYLEGKRFYRNEKLGDSITVGDMSEVYIVSAENPFETEWRNVTLLCIHKETGVLLASWPANSEFENSGDYCNIGFGTNDDGEDGGSYKYDMEHYMDETISIGGRTYYNWQGYGGEGYGGIEYDVLGQSFEITTKVYFEGSIGSLYYAFNSILPQSNQEVTEVYSTETNLIYLCEDRVIDNIVYEEYKAFKGVIYRMIDEHGNDLPYDFKNIKFYMYNSWSYTFGKVNDASIFPGARTQCFGNVVNYKSKTLLPFVCLGNAVQNRIKGAYTEIYLSGNATCNDLVFTTASKLNASASFDGNQLAIDKDITTNGAFGKNRAVYLYTPLVTTGTIYGCQFDVNSRSSTPLTINVGRMNDCIVNGCGTFSIKSSSGSTTGYLFSSTINLGVGGSNVTLKTSNTTSLSNRIEGVFLNAFNWGTSEKTIDISKFPLNSTYPLHIAQNTSGVVVMWNDADIPNQVGANTQSISDNLSSIESIEGSIESIEGSIESIEGSIESIEEKINEYHPEE